MIKALMRRLARLAAGGQHRDGTPGRLNRRFMASATNTRPPSPTSVLRTCASSSKSTNRTWRPTQTSRQRSPSPGLDRPVTLAPRPRLCICASGAVPILLADSCGAAIKVRVCSIASALARTWSCRRQHRRGLIEGGLANWICDSVALRR